MQCLLDGASTVGLTYAVYLIGASYHDKYACDRIWNWLSPQCQVADFVRTTAKQWVYRWYWQVGTVIAARAGHWADKMSKEASRLALDATDNTRSIWATAKMATPSRTRSSIDESNTV